MRLRYQFISVTCHGFQQDIYHSDSIQCLSRGKVRKEEANIHLDTFLSMRGDAFKVNAGRTVCALSKYLN